MVSLPAFGVLLLCAFFGALRAYRIGEPLRTLAPHEAFTELIEQHRSRLALLVLVTALIPALALPFLHNLTPFTPARQAAFTLFFLLDVFLIGFAVAIGDFPTRKIVFGDRRSVLAFVRFTARLILAFFGFWVVLFFAPMFLHQAGEGPGVWAAGGALASLLLLWSANFRQVFCRLLEARPLEDAALLARFEAVVARSTAHRPEIYESGPWDGGWCNAVALPAAGTPRIVMSHSLLQLLDEDEATAIFAHEVAHLEDFDPPAVRKMRRWETFLIIAACFLEPVILTINPAYGPMGFWVWMPVAIGLIAWRIKDMQHRETASDLRAVDLAGDAEAMIRALTKVYDASRLPRRMATEVERHSSHPSLARRIQDIREHAGLPGPADVDGTARTPAAHAPDPAPGCTAGPATVREGSSIRPAPVAHRKNWIAGFVSRKKPREVMVLDAHRVTWLLLPRDRKGEVPANGAWTPAAFNALKKIAEKEHSVTYRGLTELRLVLRKDGAILRAVERSNGLAQKSTNFAIAADAIGPVRELLDRVDTGLAPLSALNIRTHMPLRLVCFATAILALFASMHGIISGGTVLWLLVISIPALTLAYRPWLAAFGAMALWGALSKIVLSWDTSWWSPSSWVLITAIILAGAYLLRRSIARADEPEESRLANGTPAAVSLCLLILATAIAIVQLYSLKDGDTYAKIYTFALNSSASFLPFIGAGAALFTGKRFTTRALGILVALVGLSHAWIGSQHFLENFSQDPLIPKVAPFASSDAPFQAAQEIRLEGAHRGLELSPGGSRFFTEPLFEIPDNTRDGDGAPAGTPFRIFDWDGSFVDTTALQLHFLDDDTLLALSAAGEGQVEIQTRPADDPSKVLWRCVLPGVKPEDHFSLVGKGNKWRVSVNPAEGITLRLGGLIGTGIFEMHSWSNRSYGDHWRYVGAGDRCLEVVWGGAQRGAPASVERLAWIFQRYWQQNKLQWLTDLGAERPGRSVLWADAQEPAFGETELMLFLYGPSRGWVCSADTAGGMIVPLAAVQPHYESHWDGNHLALLHRDRLMIAAPALGSAVNLPLPRKADWNTELALANATVALGWTEGDTSHVVLLDIPELPDARTD